MNRIQKTICSRHSTILKKQGIGRRRAEGFGRIRISDPFHLEGEQA